MSQCFPEGTSPRGGTHTPHTTNMDTIYEQQFRNERKERKEEERKEEEEGEEKEEEEGDEKSTWGCLTSLDGAGSPPKKEMSACQRIPRLAVHAAQDDRKHWAHLVRSQSKA